MRIHPKDTLFGQPILKIRKVVRFAMDGRLIGAKKQIIIDKVAQILNQPLNTVKEVFELMLKEDYLEIKKEKFSDESYQWIVSETEKGRRLGITNANPPISREKADQLLNELLERVEIINNLDLSFKVQSIKIFGSYLSEQAILGDLDIAFKLRRIKPKNKFERKSDERIEIALKNGKRFSNFLEQLYWPEKEVILLLKTKKKGLSLHNEDDDEIAANAEFRLVFEYIHQYLSLITNTN